VLQARAQAAIAVGASSHRTSKPPRIQPDSHSGLNFFDQWQYGFNLNWELDFGAVPPGIASADATLDASVWDYNFGSSRCWATWAELLQIRRTKSRSD